MALTLIDASPAYAIAVADRIFILYEREVLDSGALRRIRGEIERAGNQGLLAYLQIRELREVRPRVIAEADRQAWVELANAAKRSADFGAIVIPQEGFAGAATRATVSTVLLLSRIRKPVRVFDGVAKATRWLAERIRGAPGAPSEAQIVAAAREVAAAIDGAPSRPWP